MGVQRISRTVVAGLAILVVAVVGIRALRSDEALAEGLIQANGRLEGDHFTVASKFAGRVAEVVVREGDSVETGQVLVRLEDSQIQARVVQAQQAVAAVAARVRAAETALEVAGSEVPLAIATAEAGVDHARAVLKQALAAHQQASRDSGRFSRLAEKGTVDVHRAEQAELQSLVARENVASARSGVRVAERQLDQAQLGPTRLLAKEREVFALRSQQKQAEGALSEAQSVAEDLAVVASTDGVVASRMIEPGETVGAGAPMLDLVDLDRLYLKVYVPEIQVGKLRLGLAARIHVDAFPEQPFEATLRFIGSRAEFTPKEVQTPDERVKLVYAVKLYVEDNQEHRLTPGMPADAVIRWQEDVPWQSPIW